MTKEIRESGYMPTFKVQGQIHLPIVSLHPLPNEGLKVLQIYFVGDGTQVEQHYKNALQLRQDIGTSVAKYVESSQLLHTKLQIGH